MLNPKTAADFARIYTDAALMMEWVHQAPTIRDQMVRAHHCLGVAQRPQGRFGIDSTPVAVQDALRTFIDWCNHEAAPLRAHIIAERGEGVTWEAVWRHMPANLRTLGFEYGDAALLGVANADMSDEIAEARRAESDAAYAEQTVDRAARRRAQRQARVDSREWVRRNR